MMHDIESEVRVREESMSGRHCSFCSKSEGELRFLFVGREANICHDCITRVTWATRERQQFGFLFRAMRWWLACQKRRNYAILPIALPANILAWNSAVALWEILGRPAWLQTSAAVISYLVIGLTYTIVLSVIASLLMARSGGGRAFIAGLWAIAGFTVGHTFGWAPGITAGVLSSIAGYAAAVDLIPAHQPQES